MTKTTQPIRKDYVVMLHGIARTRRHMQPLASYLSAQGYEVLNLNYPSTKKSLEDLREITWQNIRGKLLEDKPVHFVGYSMGGLLIRAMLAKYRPATLGRVVLLGTPNKGSEVADWLKNNWLYKTFWGPAGQQLTTRHEEHNHLWGVVDFELGIVAGNHQFYPITSQMIKGESDGLVSVESTKIEGMKDHRIVRVSHAFLPSNKIVQKQTAHFLRHGVFV